MTNFYLIAEPGAPGTPECVSRDRKHIEVKWAPPRNDGGNPVKGYIVERREKAAKKKEWTKINRGEVHKVCFTNEFTTYVTILIVFQATSFVDENVTAMKEYEYRVTAVNDAGPGEPSDSSGNISARPEKGNSNIDEQATNVQN